MTKLTTERLDEIANIKITEFSDGTDTANGAYQSVGSSEIVLMARQLLAYEQAAKNPVAWIVHMRTGDQFTTDGDFVGLGEATHGIHSTPLYSAPVLPKQPELIGMKVSIDTGSDNIGHRLFGEIVGTSDSNGVPVLCIEVTENNDAEPAPAQPVIPEGLIKAINRLLDNDGSRGCFDALEQHRAKTELERLLAAAQQNEPQNIPENIPAQPVSEPRTVGCFSYGTAHGFNLHQTAKQATADAEAMIDDYRGDACGWDEETDSICWGVILQQATKVDERPRTEDDTHLDPRVDTVRDYALLPAQPVSEPSDYPVIPDGWKLVPVEPTPKMLVAAMGMFTVEELAEAWGDMIEAAPTQESE